MQGVKWWIAAALAAVALLVALAGCGLFEKAQGAGKGKTATVVRAVDGDTIVVRAGEGEQSVRLLQIDTPEVFGESECYGPEASAAMKRMAKPGDRVQLVADRSQDDVDRYGRLLRYVVEDGRDLGLAQLKSGNAPVYVFETEGRRIARYRAAEASARDAGRGAWGACGGF